MRGQKRGDETRGRGEESRGEEEKREVKAGGIVVFFCVLCCAVGRMRFVH